MEIQDINNQILVKQTQLRVEKNPNKKQELNKQLQILQFKKEIEEIKLRITKLSPNN